MIQQAMSAPGRALAASSATISFGNYRVDGSQITYETDDGVQFSGEFVDGALRQGEKIFYKAA